jgi:hypothetical protein
VAQGEADIAAVLFALAADVTGVGHCHPLINETHHSSRSKLKSICSKIGKWT